MKLLAVDIYIDFICIGSECPISCCGGDWGILIDDESMDYYLSVEGKFGDKIRKNITRMNGRNAFKLDKNSRTCVFLNENKLCNIYKTLGPDALCETCRSYPREIFRIGDTDFCYLTNSCPEVNRLMMQKKNPIEILYDDSDDTSEEIENFDRKRFERTLSALVAGMHLIKNKEITLRNRLVLVLFFVNRFQEIISTGKDPSGIVDVFSQPLLYSTFIGNSYVGQDGYLSKIHAFLIVFRSMISESYDHPMWEKCKILANNIVNNEYDDLIILRDSFSVIESEEIQNELEQIMAYRFFVFFMKGYDNSDYFEKLVYEYVIYASFISYIAISGYGGKNEGSSIEDRIMFYTLCSRIEHTTKQKKDMIDSIRRSGFYEIENLIKLI